MKEVSGELTRPRRFPERYCLNKRVFPKLHQKEADRDTRNPISYLWHLLRFLPAIKRQCIQSRWQVIDGGRVLTPAFPHTEAMTLAYFQRAIRRTRVSAYAFHHHG